MNKLVSFAKVILRRVIPDDIIAEYRKEHNLEEVDEKVLVITLDSCRFDVFQESYEDQLPAKNVRKAYSPACWTLPSHESIVRGMIPFGDFEDPILDLGYNDGFRLPMQHEYSFGSTAMPLLSKDNIIDNDMHKVFDDYFCSRDYISAEEVLEKASDYIPENQSFFGLINLGETHLPYTKDEDTSASDILDDLRSGELGKEKALEMQEKACRDLLNKLSSFRESIPEGTLVVVTADHGDLLGEADGYGHAPSKHASFHRKLFEVPYLYWYES